MQKYIETENNKKKVAKKEMQNKTKTRFQMQCKSAEAKRINAEKVFAQNIKRHLLQPQIILFNLFGILMRRAKRFSF